MQWPEGFMWGTGASSTQCEGASPASDWWDWERAGHAPLSGDGNGFATRYAEDFGLLAGLGLRHHRLSIEWARIEPEPGRHDAAAIAHYRDVLSAALDAGVEPWVCLHHFTLPRWFAATGGFLVEQNRTDAWARHVDFIAETFGDLVGGWQPVNETNYYAFAAYLGRGWPPGHNSFEECATVSEAMQLATAEAAVRLKQTGAPVASIFGLSGQQTLDDTPETTRLAEPARRPPLAGRARAVPGRRAAHPEPRAGRTARPRRLLRPDRLLLLHDRRHREGAMVAVPGRMHRCRRSATASGPTASASCSTGSTRWSRARRCWSPSTASAPTTTTQRAAYLARGLRGHQRGHRPRRRRARAVPLDRRRQLRVAPRLRRPLRDHRPATATSVRAPRC